MTAERRLLFGLEDIKAVCLECAGCGARTSFPPERAKPIPSACGHCGEAWKGGKIKPRQLNGTAYDGFVLSISAHRTLIREGAVEGFKILLEFDEPSPSTVPAK